MITKRCSCGCTRHAMIGDPDAVAELVEAMEATVGEEGILGSQAYQPLKSED